VLALNLLRVVFARAVDFRSKIPLVCAPIVCIIPRDAKGREQRLQLQKPLILTPPKDRGQDLPGRVSEGMPEPPWFLLLPAKAPHFVHFGFVHALQDDLDLARGQAGNEGAIHR
jgi:hypothetical protein